MTIAVIGAGAFGTALAVALAQNTPIWLWARSPQHADEISKMRLNQRRLPGIPLPKNVSVTANLADIRSASTVLLAVPMQQMGPFLREHGGSLDGREIVACSKGVDLQTIQGPTALIAAACPAAAAAILTGPSFAADIARGLPTALTLACANDAAGKALQLRLSTSSLRLYRTTDTIGAELGGALKNIVAIAAGVVIGSGLGNSARAALMTRGFAEMNRLATALGARPETMAGLSGLGDLILTCTSDQSRNFRFGLALGSGAPFDMTTTVEGVATAKAVTILAKKHSIDMPIADMVSALIEKHITVADATQALLSRPLKQE